MTTNRKWVNRLVEKENSHSDSNFVRVEKQDKFEDCLSKLKISNFDLIEKQKLARSQKYKEKNSRLWTVFRKEIDPKSIPSTSNQNLNRTKSFQEAKTNIETCELKGKDSIDASVKYQTLPNIKNLEDTVFEIKHSLYDLEALLMKNDANEDDFMRFIKCKELLSENMYLKQKVISLEEELDGKNQRIKMLEKLVLETHL